MLQSNGSKQGNDFVNDFFRDSKKRESLLQLWIQKLSFDGVKGAHPNDGHVREFNSLIVDDYVEFRYPYFSYSPNVGDKIALGHQDKYKIVEVIKVEKVTYGLNSYQRYYFKPFKE